MNAATVEYPHDGVITVPKLHIPSTTACDFVKYGIFSLTFRVHSLNSLFLLLAISSLCALTPWLFSPPPFSSYLIPYP